MKVNFTEKLLTLRKEKGLSQEQLAELLNVSRQAVSKWESGQTYPEIDKLIILSDLFKITLDDLVKDKTIESIANIDESEINDNEKEDEDDILIISGAFIIGIAIGLITGNYMWGTIGCFLAYGFIEIIKGIKGFNTSK